MESTVGISATQLANGTPSTKRIILKAFFKDDKCTISPAKDFNGRYVGIQENIPEIEKMKMGYMPTVDSRVKIHDGMEIDLNDPTWARDWEWMKNCQEIAGGFKEGQNTPGAYFYVYRPGTESKEAVDIAKKDVKLRSYILQDSNENLYNRVKVLGTDMSTSTITDVQEYLLSLVGTSPESIENVYEGRLFVLELLYMNALEKGIIKKRGGTLVYGDTFLGVDRNAAIAFFGNSKNVVVTSAIEAVTYGRKIVSDNPLENEVTDDIVEDDSEVLEAMELAANAPKTTINKLAKARAVKKKQ